MTTEQKSYNPSFNACCRMRGRALSWNIPTRLVHPAAPIRGTEVGGTSFRRFTPRSRALASVFQRVTWSLTLGKSKSRWIRTGTYPGDVSCCPAGSGGTSYDHFLGKSISGTKRRRGSFVAAPTTRPRRLWYRAVDSDVRSAVPVSRTSRRFGSAGRDRIPTGQSSRRPQRG